MLDKHAFETTASIASWANTTFGQATNSTAMAIRANEEMAELLSKCARNAGSCSILDECADVIIVLARLVDYYGSSISEIVNQKMAVNRQRRWVVDGNGHGHHVKDAVNGSSGS